MGRLAETRSGASRRGARGGDDWFAEFASLSVGDAIDLEGLREFRGRVAEGEIAIVLKAFHRPSGSLQALKILRPALLDDEAMLRLFEEEVEKLAAVDAEACARLTDFGKFTTGERGGSSRTWWFVATEWIEGRTVRDLLRDGGGRGPTLSLGVIAADERTTEVCPSGLTPDDAFHVLDSAARAAAELHRVGLVHLAIRPDNLILNRQNRVRMVGLGVPADLRRAADARFGTMWQGSRYAPPEIARGDDASAGSASDVFQLGVLGYELFIGAPCSPLLAYDEVCEAAPYVPASFDALLMACLDDPDRRPENGDAFLAALREVVAGFDANRRRRRRTPGRKARDVWADIEQRALRMPPMWGAVAGACRRLLEEKPHLLPFGKIPRERVEALLREAEAGLMAARRGHLDDLTAAAEWRVAEEFIDRLGGDVSREEQDGLRVALARSKVAALPRNSADRRATLARLQELAGDSRVPGDIRAEATEVLNEAMVESVSPATPAIPVLSDLGVLPPVERFRVETGGDATTWRVVVGPAIRLGRGSFDEFGNHVDLRPTRREAAESSITLNLAQRISRAGHLELRVGAGGLEVFCLGTHGAAIDGEALRRGERTALGDEGRGTLAQGAAEFVYRVWKDRDGVPVAVSLDFTAGVGAGRHAAWVLTELPFQVFEAGSGARGCLLPTPDGWLVDGRGEGLRVGSGPSGKHVKVPWPEGEDIELTPDCRLRRG